jgi:Putative zinc-finger
MICSQVRSENLIERYLDGKLAGPDRDAFEEHYFNCEDCFAQLEAARAAQPVLREMGIAEELKKPNLTIGWIAAGVAAAVIAWALIDTSISSPPVVATKTESAKPLLALSEIEPPPYTATVLRGQEENPGKQAFRAAMASYSKHDWAATQLELTHVLREYPGQADALYFRGIARLMAGNAVDAFGDLSEVIKRGAATPYEEEARYYDAQALLVLSSAGPARQQLESVIQMHGDYEAKARALLQRQSPTATKPPQ